MNLRYFSGKYDSVKQKAAYKFLKMPEPQAWDNLYLYYTASMRMEMLFTERLIIPDAFWYDGAYFAAMFKLQNEFKGFQDFLVKNPLLEVRRRKNHVKSMYAKPFEFSSLIQDSSTENSFSHAVFRFGEYLKTHPDIIPSPFQMADYTSMLKAFIRSYSNAHMSECEEFCDRQISLDSMGGVRFIQWDDARMLSLPTQFDSPYIYGGRRKKVISNREALIREMNKAVSNYGTRFKAKAEQFRDLIQTPATFPIRTTINQLLRDIQRDISADDPHFRKLYDTFNIVYGLGMAKQHDCSLFDLMDDNNVLSHSQNNAPDMTFMNIPKDILENVGGCTWQEFSKVMQRPSMIQNRDRWLNTFTQAHNENDSRNIEKILPAFNSLSDQLIISFQGLFDVVCRKSQFYDNNTDDTFIGSGSSEFTAFANEICINVPSANENAHIVRIRSEIKNSPVDDVLDTLISYPKNIFKSLE